MDEKEYYIWVGSKLRELREKEGLKQKDVAAKAKMSAQFLSNVENYGKKVSIFQLDLILQAIGKTMADLFENADAEKKKLTLTLNGDEIGQLSNGEKMAFAEKVKLFFKVAFSERKSARKWRRWDMMLIDSRKSCQCWKKSILSLPRKPRKYNTCLKRLSIKY